MTATRLADPYRDLTVIDSRAPRFNQAVIGVVAVLAIATGWWWLLAAVTGFCKGFEAYKLGCRLTGQPFVSCPIGDRSGPRQPLPLDTPDLSPPRS